MESWTHMGCTANIIIKDIIHVFASISKNMHILLMGPRYHERCQSSLWNLIDWNIIQIQIQIQILWKVTILSQMSYVPSKCEKNVSINFHKYLLYDISLWKWSCRPHGRQTSLCNHLTKIYMIPSWIFQMTTISHCGCDKMANILLMTLSNAFSSEKIFVFWCNKKIFVFWYDMFSKGPLR